MQSRRQQQTLQHTAPAVAHLPGESGFELTLSQETPITDTTSKATVGTALLVVASLLMPVGAAMADGTTMGGGTMGNGNWYENSGVWLPVLAIVVVGAVLFAVLRRRQ